MSSEAQPLELFYKLPTAVQKAQDADGVASLMSGVLRASSSALAVSDRVMDSQSITTITPFLVLPWVNLRIKLSDMVDAGSVLYGDPQVYGGGLLYGQLQGNRYRVPIPTEWNDIGFISDGVEAPVAVLDGSKFQITTINGQKYISFIKNPFDTFAPYPVTSSDGLLDSEVSVWLHQLELDDKAVFYRFGADVGLGYANNDNYLDSTKLVRESLIRGLSSTLLQRVLSAGAGVELAVGDEVVESITTTTAGLVIVTSKKAYRYVAGSTAIVSVGQSLEQYSALVDTVRVYDFSEYSTLLPSIPGLVVNTVAGKLNFPNIQTTWTYAITSGQPDARFPVYGDASAIDAFWANSLNYGSTHTPLATLVGVSASGVVSVNPMEFVIRNVLQPALVLAVVRPELFRNGLPQLFARLSGLLPVNALVLTSQSVIGLPVQSYDLSTQSSATGAVYPCIDNPTDIISVSGYDLTLSAMTPTVTAL